MALIIKDRVKQSCTAPSTTDPFDFTGASATTGFQTFVDALANGDTCLYAASDSSGNWETGLGTWTEASDQLARTTILASSNAGSAETFSGTVTVAITMPAQLVEMSAFAASAVNPGGRLTLESGVAISTSDQASKTTIYYTPYTHGFISLHDGTRWRLVAFTEKSLALGTITSARPYDVFGYISSGELTLELLSWTSDTARATALTTQDGILVKSGDTTRRYLGTFRTTSTTTTEESATKRFVWNEYNRVPRYATKASGSASHTYASGTPQYFNNDSSMKIELVVGRAGLSLICLATAVITTDAGEYAVIGIGDNTTASIGSGRVDIDSGATLTSTRLQASRTYTPALGYNYYPLLEMCPASEIITFDFGGLHMQWES